MSARKCLLLIIVCFASACSRTEKPISATQPSGPSPNPALTPAEVVKIVILAMQHNDTPETDAGIATAFRFASPGNRKFTGPVEHFIPMVKSPAYIALLNFKSVEFSPIEIRGNEARMMIKMKRE